MSFDLPARETAGDGEGGERQQRGIIAVDGVNPPGGGKADGRVGHEEDRLPRCRRQQPKDALGLGDGCEPRGTDGGIELAEGTFEASWLREQVEGRAGGTDASEDGKAGGHAPASSWQESDRKGSGAGGRENDQVQRERIAMAHEPAGWRGRQKKGSEQGRARSRSRCAIHLRCRGR